MRARHYRTPGVRHGRGLEPRLASLVRVGVIVAFLLNWAYLLAAGR